MASRLFLSYNSRDHEAVERVRAALEIHGVRTFLDRLDLVPGQPWVMGLEEGLSRATAVAIFLGPHGLGNWQRREMWLALDRQAQAEGKGEVFFVMPVVLPDARELGASFLTLNTWIDLRQRLDDEQAISRLARAVLGEVPRAGAIGGEESAPQICPYRSLSAFREEDAALFFGREEETHELLAMVRSLPLVAVIGASGSGKSSLVKAGLLPWLRRERPPADCWEIAAFAPGGEAYHRLAAALMPLLEPDAAEVDLLAEAERLGMLLASGGIRLGSVVERVLEKSNGAARLLLVVDQFEEIFTHSSAEDRQQFTELLRAGTTQSRLTVLLTVRGDFFGAVLSLPREFAKAVNRGQLNLLSLSDEGLEAAIRQPAEKTKMSFAPGLAERVQDDVAGEPGKLPLLEFALTELWHRSLPGATLTHQAYEEVGKVSGAITQRAARFFQSLEGKDRTLLRGLMTRLVRVAESPEAGPDTRQRLRLAELSTEARYLIGRLANERLVVTGLDTATREEVAELAHESLIREWKELRNWLEEGRAVLFFRQRLREEVAERRKHPTDESYLLQGSRLAEAEGWLARHRDDFSEEERELLAASQDLRERRERQTRTRRRVVVCLLLLGIGLGAFLLSEHWELERRKRLATSQFLSSLSQEILAQKPQLATLLAREAMIRSRDAGGAVLAQAEAALRAGLYDCGGDPIDQPDPEVLGAVLGSRGRWLATETLDHRVRLTVLTPEAEVEERLPPLDTDGRLSVQFSPQGAYLVAAGEKRSTTVWRLGLKGAKRILETEVASPQVVFSGDERYLAIVTNSVQIDLWGLGTAGEGTPTRLTVDSQSSSAVTRLAFSRDGRWLAAAYVDQSATVWEVAQDHAAGRRVESGNSVRDLDFTGDSTALILAQGTTLGVVRLASERPIRPEVNVQYRYPRRHREFSGVNALGETRAIVKSEFGSRGVFELNREGAGLLESVNFYGSILEPLLGVSPSGRFVALNNKNGGLEIRLVGFMSFFEGQYPRTLGFDEGHRGITFGEGDRWALAWGNSGQLRRFSLEPGWEHSEPTVLNWSSRGPSFDLRGGPVWIPASPPTSGGDVVANLLTFSERDFPTIQKLYCEALSGSAGDLAFATGGKWFVALDSGGEGCKWRLDEQRFRGQSFRAQLPPGPLGKSLGLSENGRWLFVLAKSGTVYRLDLQEPGADAQETLTGLKPDDIAGATVSADGTWLAVSLGGVGIVLAGVGSEKPTGDSLVLEPGLKDGARALLFSPDSQSLLAGARMGPAYLWAVGKPDPAERPLMLDLEGLTSALFVGGGDELITGAGNGVVSIFRFSAHEKLQLQERELFAGGEIMSLAASEESETILVATLGAGTVLWRRQTSVEGDTRVRLPGTIPASASSPW